MAHRSSTDRHKPLSAILILSLGNQVNLRGLFAREGPLAAQAISTARVARRADEVAADHATPFGSSPPMRPISRKFQRTTRLKDCSQSRCISGGRARSPDKHQRGARTADDRDVNAFAVILEVGGSSICFNPSVTFAEYVCVSWRGSTHDQHGRNPGRSHLLVYRAR